jgi:hypothetical protein
MREFHIRPAKRGMNKVSPNVYRKLLEDDNKAPTPLQSTALAPKSPSKPRIAKTSVGVLGIVNSTKLPFPASERLSNQAGATNLSKFSVLPNEPKVLILEQAL